MEFLQKPPEWLLRALPDAAKGFIENGGAGWWLTLGVGGLVLLGLLFVLFKVLFRRPPPEPKDDDLVEYLEDFQALPPSTGDRRLLVEGVPVRLRLVVIAPPGAGAKIDIERMSRLLNAVVTGLGDVADGDKPSVRIWPRQHSYEGFCKLFHNNTVIPKNEDETSTRWVMLAGRAKIGDKQYMLGLGLEAIKPTTVGRRTLKPHEWASVLRVRVRD